VQFAEVHIEGIAGLQVADMAYAEQLGYRIKLLGIARRAGAGVELRVHPALVQVGHLMAAVDGSMNAVLVQSDAAGLTLYYGAGAGSEQTASAVIADLVDVARADSASPHQRVPHLGFQSQTLLELPVLPIAEGVSGYYLRFDLAPDGLVQAPSEVLQCLAQFGVGVQSQACLPHHRDAARKAYTVLTRPVAQAVLLQSLQQMQALPSAPGLPTVLRVEPLA
jgi:homoserine dehydrogenase